MVLSWSLIIFLAVWQTKTTIKSTIPVSNQNCAHSVRVNLKWLFTTIYLTTSSPNMVNITWSVIKATFDPAIFPFLDNYQVVQVPLQRS